MELAPLTKSVSPPPKEESHVKKNNIINSKRIGDLFHSKILCSEIQKITSCGYFFDSIKK